MSNIFFEKPILNSPYAYPERHWELDPDGQPTQAIIDKRRRAEFITPIPKPKKRKGSASQSDLLFDEGAGLTSEEQQYDEARTQRTEASSYQCRTPGGGQVATATQSS